MFTRVLLVVGLLLSVSGCGVADRVFELQRQSIRITETLKKDHAVDAQVSLNVGGGNYLTATITMDANKVRGLTIDELTQRISNVVSGEVQRVPDELLVVLRTTKSGTLH
jgi:molybdopterin-binding protein